MDILGIGIAVFWTIVVLGIAVIAFGLAFDDMRPVLIGMFGIAGTLVLNAVFLLVLLRTVLGPERYSTVATLATLAVLSAIAGIVVSAFATFLIREDNPFKNLY